MPQGPKNEASILLEEEFEEILSDWIATQKEEGVRRSDLFSDAEGREQTGLILRALGQGVRRAEIGTRFDLTHEEWADLRGALQNVTEERLQRGVTATEMAAFIQALKATLFERLKNRLKKRPDDLVDQIWLMTRLVDAFALYTTAIFAEGREEVIRRQQSEMVELSTPVIQLWDDILTIPLIGTLDSGRAQDVMESLLESIVERGAETVIVDITGVQTVDTQVAQHLLRTAAAVRLMGAECIISGISPRIAQTMVELGVEVGDIVTRSSIQGALVYAFGKSGLRLVAASTHAAGHAHG